MAEDFDQDFELLPADGRDLTPDEQLAALLVDVPTDVDEGPLPMGRSWAFDFVAGQFARHGTSPAEIFGLDTVREWIEKALRVRRFAHLIYSEEYGLDDVELIGKPFDPALAGSYSSAVREALIVHDRISNVTNFKFTKDADDDAIFVEFTVAVDTGEQFVANATLGAA